MDPRTVIATHLHSLGFPATIKEDQDSVTATVDIDDQQAELKFDKGAEYSQHAVLVKIKKEEDRIRRQNETGPYGKAQAANGDEPVKMPTKAEALGQEETDGKKGDSGDKDENGDAPTNTGTTGRNAAADGAAGEHPTADASENNEAPGTDETTEDGQQVSAEPIN